MTKLTEQELNLKELLECCNQLHLPVAQKDVPAKIDQYRNILKKVPNHPLSINLWNNLGILQDRGGNPELAKLTYIAALEMKPDFVPAIVNYAILMEKLGELDEAFRLMGNKLMPQEWELGRMNQRGRMYEVAGRLKEAEVDFLSSLLIDPGQLDVLQHYTHLRAKQCRWPVLVDLPNLPIQYQKQHMGVMGSLAYIDDPQFHFETAFSFVKAKYKTDAKRYLAKKRKKHPRIRLGFLSSDLRWHAVSILAVEFFECIDQSVFETFAFDFSVNDKTAFRQRVLSAFEHVKPIHDLSDIEAAQLIADNEIDVLIDLNGLTSNARPTILMYKPAHLQITWLGSLTTTAIKEIDYVLTDEKVFGKNSEQYYIEKPLYLKTGMHLHDSKRDVGVTKPKSEYGLPEGKFIFCCFNSNFKITEDIFNIWMQILQATPNSVLWILADNDCAKSTFETRALAAGIDSARIIMAHRVLPEDYLAQFKVADLFLDTSPYNAGTTAIDCLFVGLPVLTCPGKSVAARVAGGILEHAGYPSLIAKDWDDYKKKAIEFALNPQLIEKLKLDLNSPSKMTSALFDTKAKAKDFEGVILDALSVHAPF